MKKYLFVIAAGLLLAACGSGNQEDNKEAQQDSMAVETSETVEGLINNLESQFESDTTAIDEAVEDTAE